MWRNLKSPSLCVQLYKYGILLQKSFLAIYTVLIQKVIFFALYAVFRKIGLLQFTRYCVEKILAKISDRGEKMTNIKYGDAHPNHPTSVAKRN